jgi:hypothetical protein
MKTSHAILICVVFFALILGLTWAVQGNEFFLAKVFMPKMEQVRRTTFEQSKAYRQGMVQEITKMMFDYQAADSSHQDALADIILHRVADFDPDAMPPDMRVFVDKLKAKKMGSDLKTETK